jgi:hypothetical protein
MQTPTHRSVSEPVESARRPVGRSVDPGEAGRQRVSRRKIDCAGDPEVHQRSTLGRGGRASGAELEPLR